MPLSRCANAPVMGHATLDAVSKCPLCAPKAREIMGLPPLSPQSIQRVGGTKPYVILEDPNASPEDLRVLAETLLRQDSSDLLDVAGHANTPPDVLAEIAWESRNDRIRAKALRNKAMPREVLLEVIDDLTEEKSVRGVALRRSDVFSDELLARYAPSLGLQNLAPVANLRPLSEASARLLLDRAEEDFSMGAAAYIVENLVMNNSVSDELRTEAARKFFSDRVKNVAQGIGTSGGWMSDVSNEKLTEIIRRCDDDELRSLSRMLDASQWRPIAESFLRAQKPMDSDVMSHMWQTKVDTSEFWEHPDVTREQFEVAVFGTTFYGSQRIDVITKALKSSRCPSDVIGRAIHGEGLDNADLMASLAYNPNLTEAQVDEIKKTHGLKPLVCLSLLRNGRTGRDFDDAAIRRWRSRSINTAVEFIIKGDASDEVIRDVSEGEHGKASEAARRVAQERVMKRFGVTVEGADHIIESSDWTVADNDSPSVTVARVMHQALED